MKILILCDQGNNRSVVLASRLKYCGDPYHDIIPLGIQMNSRETLMMLSQTWAEKIIVVDVGIEQFMKELLPKKYHHLLDLWNIGPDIYRRPHNPLLLALVTQMIEEHPELKQRR